MIKINMTDKNVNNEYMILIRMVYQQYIHIFRMTKKKGN